MSASSLLGRKALLNGNIQLAEQYFVKEEILQGEITSEIIENRAYYALYFRKFDLALKLIQELEPSQEQSKLYGLYHYFKANLSVSLDFAIKGNDQDLIQHLQQMQQLLG